jgi:hypothetical protein
LIEDAEHAIERLIGTGNWTYLKPQRIAVKLENIRLVFVSRSIMTPVPASTDNIMDRHCNF